MFSAINISASGLTAERLRLDSISSNLANANTSAPPGQQVYRRQVAVLAPARGRGPVGVQVLGLEEEDAPPRLVYDPYHPDADEAGYVAYANINVVTEMVDMITATRAYEANITAINTAKSMFIKTLEIGRG
ncbi:MAG: flagellar basal body rod protein FlgC [Limnochordia bacterium]|nr:flagellar basal body rod protein FlgC [Bacillota bacterium]